MRSSFPSLPFALNTYPRLYSSAPYCFRSPPSPHPPLHIIYNLASHFFDSLCCAVHLPPCIPCTHIIIRLPSARVLVLTLPVCLTAAV
ncbi:hypothetical protein PLICRDRAFT_402602 [Plicaturopsis crispa FD-325 SS-3]|nr:hypothetical protein PLICRDRAFT_402602 [Plicaturopsis crispa FD-325 SS-3]